MQKFDLSLWLQDKSRKVVTRDGREVEIYYNPNSRIPLIGRTPDNEIHQYNENGYQYETMNQAKNDLFFADEEKELTELQKTLEEDCDCYVNLYNDGKTREELREWIKGWCPRIIDLARKELEEDYYLCAKDDSLWEDGYKNGKQDAGEAKVKELVAEFEKGRQDALKDLPKWKKVPSHEKQTMYGMSEISDVYYNGYFIHLDDIYRVLPKEE